MWWTKYQKHMSVYIFNTYYNFQGLDLIFHKYDSSKFTDVFSSFDQGLLIGAIFIDLTKAFDMVDHYLLLEKLYSIKMLSSGLMHVFRRDVSVLCFRVLVLNPTI